jgi:hypothetical protein
MPRCAPITILVAALAATGCASTLTQPAPTPAAAGPFRSDLGGFTIVMPAPVEQRFAREGAVEMVLAASHWDDVSYEATFFDLPSALDDEAQAALMERVVVGLSGVPGVRVRALETTFTEELPSTELDLAIGGGRRGTWRLFVVDGVRMFQLSIIGPSVGHEERAARFFESFELLEHPAPPSDLLYAGSAADDVLALVSP